MTTTTIEAIYEQGVLRPTKPLTLPEGTKVEVIVIAPDASGAKKARFSWEQTPANQDNYSGSVADELVRQRREE